MNVHELKENDPARFEQEYVCWSQSDVYYDFVYDDAIVEGEKRGFLFDESGIEWSGFWSQGDGAAWSGEVRLEEFIKHAKLDDDPRYFTLLQLINNGFVDRSVAIRTWGRGRNSGCMYIPHEPSTYFWGGVDGTLQTGPFAGSQVEDLWESINGDALLEELCETVLDAARDFADKLYISLREEYEYQTSEELFIEHCEENEVKFNDN